MSTFKPRARIGAAILPALWLMIAALAANAVWVRAHHERALPQRALSNTGAPVAAGTPYTVVLQESTRTSDGVVSQQGTMTLALRGDGAYVVHYEHLGTPFVLQRSIEEPTGVSVLVDDIRERRTSIRTRSGASSKVRMDPRQGCIKNDVGEQLVDGELVGSGDRVGGYDTVRVQSGLTTFWFAPALGCAQLKASTSLSAAVNEKIATFISPGEPDNALFYVPDRYEEVQPSVFHQMNPNSTEAHSLDVFYFQRRPPQ